MRRNAAVFIAASGVLLALLLISAVVMPISNNPCAQCHGSRWQKLDLLEGDANNSFPASLGVGQTANVSVMVHNSADSTLPAYYTMSIVSVTLSSLNGRFSVKSPTFNITNMLPGTAAARWQVTGLSAGVDYFQIDAVATNTHYSSFADTYDPKEQVTVASAAVPLSAAVASPDGGENWTAGSQQAVSWSSAGGTAPVSVSLEWSQGGVGGPWLPIASGLPGTGTHAWTLPLVASTNCLVRATATDSSSPAQSAQDSSNATFTIWEPPGLNCAVTSPAGGETWQSGTAHNLTWETSGGTAPVSVELFYSATGASGPWSSIATGQAASGTFAWLVPSLQSSTCRIRAAAADSSAPARAANATSAAFTITNQSPPPLAIALKSPNGGESYYPGSSHDILWYAGGGTGAIRISLEYSSSGAAGPWTTIASGLANAGVHAWTVPPTLSSDYIVRATAADGASPPAASSDSSNSTFEVVEPPAKLSVSQTAPAGGAVWHEGETHAIQWSTQGGIPPVLIALEYTVQSPSGPWKPIASGISDTGSYAWTIPNENSTTCLVKVTAADSASQSASAVTGAFFAMLPKPAAGSNRPPVAQFGVLDATISPSKPARFSAAGAFDPDGDALTYAWNFGDGNTAAASSSPLAQHTYADEGTFFVTLTVSDGNATDSQSMAVAVSLASSGTTNPAPSEMDTYLPIGALAILAVGIIWILAAAMRREKNSERAQGYPLQPAAQYPPYQYTQHPPPGMEQSQQYPAYQYPLPPSPPPYGQPYPPPLPPAPAGLLWDLGKCVGCGACAKVCKPGAVTMVGGKPVHNPALCKRCMACAKKACRKGAISQG